MTFRTNFLRLLSLSAALAPLSAHAQSDAVQQLQSKLTAPPAQVTLNLGQLRLSQNFRAELKIENGQPQPGFFNAPLNTDEVAQQGQALTVRKVEAGSGKKGDELKITVAAPDGAYTKLAFTVPKGSLAGMTEPALEQLIAPVLTTAGAAIEADARKDAAKAQGPPTGPGPATWRVQKGKEGDEATLRGVVSRGSKRDSTVMALGCSMAKLRVHKSLVSEDPFLCVDQDGGDLAVRFKVGDRPSEAGSICNGPDDEETDTIHILPVDLGAGGLAEVLSSPGAKLTFRIDLSPEAEGKTEQPGDDVVVAEFNLPEDLSGAAALKSCPAPPNQFYGATTDACPNFPDKGLRSAKLLTAAGKPYGHENEDENTIGTDWTIHKGTKTHPLHPVLHWECSYGEGLKAAGPNEQLTKKIIPVSSTVTRCLSNGDPTVGELVAFCN